MLQPLGLDLPVPYQDYSIVHSCVSITHMNAWATSYSLLIK